MSVDNKVEGAYKRKGGHNPDGHRIHNRHQALSVIKEIYARNAVGEPVNDLIVSGLYSSHSIMGKPYKLDEKVYVISAVGKGRLEFLSAEGEFRWYSLKNKSFCQARKKGGKPEVQ